MRLALVAMETAHHRETPATRRFERVCRGLADAGHDVTVYCAQWWEGDEPTTDADGVTYHAVTEGPAPAMVAARLPGLLATHRPDLVHAVLDKPGIVLGAKLGAILARAPLVAEWYGDPLPTPVPLAKPAVRVSDCLFAPSEMVRTTLREWGATAENTTVLPESVDVDLLRETEPGPEVDVAFAHPLDASANLESLLLALAELREKDWTATVVGDGPRRDEYETQAADLRIDDRIDFVGSCDRERRVAIYRGAHVFVQTATRVPFARELLWALLAGCVGVTQYQADSSAHELIEQYPRSFRVTSAEGIAEAIVESGVYDRMTFQERFAAYDHAAVLDRYEESYAALLDGWGLFG